jgi:hypothetical protein
VLKQNAPGGTGARFGVCPPNMAPDGHGGCSGGGIDTVHSGGTSVLKPNASGGAVSAHGVLSRVQPGATSVLRGGPAARSPVFRPANTGAANAFRTTTPNSSFGVLKQGSPTGNAFRNPNYTHPIK